MADGDKNFKQVVTDNAAFITAISGALVGLWGTVKAVGGWRIIAVITVILCVVFFLWKINRARQRRRRLHFAKEPGDTGFNEALAYTSADAHRFYGRLHDTSQVLKQIAREDYGLGVLHGESGVGKTSLVQAGLMPQLRKDNILCASLAMNRLPADTGTAEGILEFIAISRKRKNRPPTFHY